MLILNALCWVLTVDPVTANILMTDKLLKETHWSEGEGEGEGEVLEPLDLPSNWICPDWTKYIVIAK